MEWFGVELERVREETPIDRSLILGLPPDRREQFRFRPGQYIQLRLPEADGKLKGVYSLSSGPGDAEVEVTIRALGEAGGQFAALPAGTRLEATMPRGNHLLDENMEAEAPDEGARRRVLVAQGAGVAPIRAYLRQLREVGHDGDVVLVHEEERPEHVLFQDEFERHDGECPWFRYVPVPPSVDAVTLEELIKPPHRTVVFAIGATAFVDPVLAVARDLGVPADNLHRERWG